LRALLASRTVPRLAFNPMHAEPEVQLDQMRRLLTQVLPQLATGAGPDSAPLAAHGASAAA